MHTLGRLVCAGAIGLAAVACDERLSDVVGPTPDLQPTFSSIQSQIFENGDRSGRPDCTSCHNTALAQFNGGLDLSHDRAYAALVNVRSSDKAGAVRVVPGDAANSYLVQKLRGSAGIVGQRMPLSGPFLTAGQIAIIEQWIAAGAPNN